MDAQSPVEVKETMFLQLEEAISRGSPRKDMVEMVMAADPSLQKSEAENVIREVFLARQRGGRRSSEGAGEMVSLILAAIGSLGAAFIGGIVWSTIVKLTGYEVGYMAWGVGVLTGLSVFILSGGSGGFLARLIAVGGAVLGILMGKYLSVQGELNAAYTNLYGGDPATIGLFAQGKLNLFFEALGRVWGGYDCLWVILAVYSAFVMAQGGHGDRA